mmetsp:Transcript_11506/g.14476  ORF Transcript_11506/g.14476 Transcript_11506/m.14476 type:complete len:127 (-) Transcript_11506:398-778(-)
MRQIKGLVTKEKKKSDSCLSETSGEDCKDLQTLEKNLGVDERRLQEDFTRAVRGSKAEPPQPVLGGVLSAPRGLDLGKLVKLPMLGAPDDSPNFEWSLLSGSHEVVRPDVRLQAITTEWLQSLTSI